MASSIAACETPSGPPAGTACLWFFARSKANGSFRKRPGESLFIDARKLDRTRRDLLWRKSSGW
jgi:hypothetical protein